MIENLLSQHIEWLQMTIKDKVKELHSYGCKLQNSQLTKGYLSKRGKKGMEIRWSNYTKKQKEKALKLSALNKEIL